MGSKKIIIIFSGYNDRAVISFIRTLEKNTIKYVVIAKGNEDFILSTRYKNRVAIVRVAQALTLVLLKEYIARIKDEFGVGRFFIAPSTEALNRFLLKFRSAIEKIGVTVPLVKESTYISVSDKKVFGVKCKNNNILTPKEYLSFSDVPLPFVAKPKEYVSLSGEIFTPFLIFNKEQKFKFSERCCLDDFYFQEYIDGKSIYLLYYFHKNGEVIKFSQENLMQQAGGGSMLAAVSSSYHETEESSKYESIFKAMGFHGLVMVEVRVTNRGDYMIEANPRFWGPSQLFVDSGINLFESFLFDYGFMPTPPGRPAPIYAKYFWFNGIESPNKNIEPPVFHEGCDEGLRKDPKSWIRYDVFNRPDTAEVLKREGDK